MNEKMKKIAEDRKDRDNLLYELDEDWSNYAPNCPDHPGVRRLRVSDNDKKKEAKVAGDIVWKCPVDGKLFTSEGSVADQTDGFAEMNNLHRNIDPVSDEGYEAVTKLRKLMSDGNETAL